MYDEPYDAYEAELASLILQELEDAPPWEGTLEYLIDEMQK